MLELRERCRTRRRSGPLQATEPALRPEYEHDEVLDGFDFVAADHYTTSDEPEAMAGAELVSEWSAAVLAPPTMSHPARIVLSVLACFAIGASSLVFGLASTAVAWMCI